MDFAYSEKVNELRKRLSDFMDRYIYPNEQTYGDQIAASGNPHHHAEIVDELKAKAKAEGLWNLFLPDDEYGAGLTNLEYAPLAEIMGRVSWASEVFNCAAPDTGNMEILAQFGTPEQKKEWLMPLLNGEIRSAFAMTEPDVASSDAANIQLSIQREGDEYILNGRKWWISGAARERCKIFIVMGKTDANSPDKYRQQSMVLVPKNTSGVTVKRNLPVMGYIDNESHCEVVFENVHVPVSYLLAYLEIEQARLLTLKAAWMIDNLGKKAAQNEIAMIKIAAPEVHTNVVNRAMQVFGGAGLSDDFPLASMWAHGRTLHVVDGPDEVHKRALARAVIRQLAK